MDIFSLLNSPKGTAKAPNVDLLRLNTKRTKITLLTPTRYLGHTPRPFYLGVAPSINVIGMVSFGAAIITKSYKTAFLFCF